MKGIPGTATILFLFLLSSCDLLGKRERKKCEGLAVLDFDFTIPYTITPAKDTFKVGDTIWIESNFSNQMYNARNGKTYTVNDFNFKMSGFIADLETNPCLATQDYLMVNAAGQLSTADREGDYYYFNYSLTSGQYSWKAGFIMQRAGLFAFLQDTNIDLHNLQDQSPAQRITECNHEAVMLNIQRTHADAHIYLLNAAADPYIREPWDMAPFANTNFAFYVKE